MQRIKLNNSSALEQVDYIMNNELVDYPTFYQPLASAACHQLTVVKMYSHNDNSKDNQTNNSIQFSYSSFCYMTLS